MMENSISYKWNPKAHTHIDKADYTTKLFKTKQATTYWWREQSIKQYNICKYICTKYWCPGFIKQTLLDRKRYIDLNIVIVGDFDTPLSHISYSD